MADQSKDEKPKALMDLAKNVTLGQLLHEQSDAATVPADARLLQALQTMKRTGFHALPVLDGKGAPCAVVSRHDLLRAVVRAVFARAKGQVPGQVKADDAGAHQAVVEALTDRTVESLVKEDAQADADQLWKYPSSEKMAKALEIFGLGARHLVVSGPFPARKADDGASEEEEKAAVGDESTLRVLSQVDLLQGLLNLYLSNSLDRLDDRTSLSAVFAQTVAEVKSLGASAGAADVVTVPHRQSVLEALLHLVDAGYNAAPVVDDSGKVSGTISTDEVVKLLNEDGTVRQSLAFLDKPVSSLHGPDAQPCTVEPGVDLARAASKLLDEGVHRLWVCDAESGKPVAVLSVSDIVFSVGGEDAVMEDANAM